MKIQCQSCQAKYTIADEKVLGKVVKIRCKKCGATIVINGNEMRGDGATDNADTNVFDYAAQGGDPWTVNVADGDQRTMTVQEIVEAYRIGTVHDDTYCWKDGMADWLPLRDIEQIYGATKLGAMRPRSESHDDISLPPQSAPSIPPGTSSPAPLFAASGSGEAASPFEGTNGNAYHAEPAAAAARRGGGRGQGADLFGKAAHAGGEEDVMTSAATGSSPTSASSSPASSGGMEEHKLTGQRNESSVLFSLSALTDDGKAPPATANRTTAAGDGSGLIDIRALSQTMGSEDKRDTNARVDDIMNLSGGGAFGAALAAPILAPPPLEMAHDYGQAGSGSGKSNTMMFVAIIGAALLIAIGIVVAVLISRPTPAPVESLGPLGSGAPGPLASGGALQEPASPSSAPAVAADNTPPPPGTGNANAKAPPVTGATKAPTKEPVAAKEPANDSAKEPPKPATPAPPKDLAGALAVAAGKDKDTPSAPANTGSLAPFDRGAAAAALGAIANNLQSCKKPGGPVGSGHVQITFAPNGSVSTANVDGGPFPGTPVGGCIAAKFRGAHVPAFSGSPMPVGKSFTLN